MAEDMLIIAFVYFSVSLVVSLLVGRFIAFQDTEAEGDAVGPKHPHWGDEGEGCGPVEAGGVAEACDSIAGEGKT